MPKTGQGGRPSVVTTPVCGSATSESRTQKHWTTWVWPPGYSECERRVEGRRDTPYDVSLLRLCRCAQLRGLWIQEAVNKGFLMECTESDLDVEG